jgi:ABC-type Fe3+-hydroxamate transport system substrate-binding protein
MTKTVTISATYNDPTTNPRRRRPTMLAMAATAVSLLLAGCSSTGSTAPPIAPATTSATSANPAASLETEKARVVAGYHAYEQALVRLFASGKADPKILEGTATPEAARHDTQQAALMFSAGDRMVGTLTSTPRSVQITGNTAVLVTCADDSKWVGVKAGTTPSPGQTGRPPALVRVQLKHGTGGKWLFAHTEEVGKC